MFMGLDHRVELKISDLYYIMRDIVARAVIDTVMELSWSYSLRAEDDAMLIKIVNDIATAGYSLNEALLQIPEHANHAHKHLGK